jgi:phytoene synthase
MLVYGNTQWERRLHELANHSSCNAIEGHATQLSLLERDRVFRAAVKQCEQITAEHSRSFYLASGLLPAVKRRAMRVLYALCRTADDLADEPSDQPLEKLQELRRGVRGAGTTRQDAVLTAWEGIRNCYKIPLCYVDQLLDGVESDLVRNRYQTFEDLSVYCYNVASTVGLMSMRITGFSSQLAVPYAIKLGIALQLTNILRDVGEDWASGRLYLPQEELDAFGLGEAEVAAGKADPRWRDFMRFQISRARQLYAEAIPGISLLHRDGRLAVSAAAVLYRGILEDIEKHQYDVFSRRAFVSRGRKLAALPIAFGHAWLARRA